MSDAMKRIEQCYEKYTKNVQIILSEAKPVDGLLGFGEDPSRHPCHEAFYYEVEALIKAVAAEEKDPAVLAQVVSYMIRAEIIWQDHRDAVWMMIAASGHALEIIPALKREDAKKLLKLYGDIVPRFRRLPVQKKIAAGLKAVSKG